MLNWLNRQCCIVKTNLFLQATVSKPWKLLHILIFSTVLKSENFKIHIDIQTHTVWYRLSLKFTYPRPSILKNIRASEFLKLLFQTSKMEGTKDEKAWEHVQVNMEQPFSRHTRFWLNHLKNYFFQVTSQEQGFGNF